MPRRQVGGFRLEGLKELEAKLEELPRSTQRSTLKRAGTNQMRKIERHAQAIVPVRSGALKSSIRIEAKTIRDADFRSRFAAAKRSGGSGRGVRAKKGSKGAVQVQVVMGGPKAPHANFVERGTHKMPAQPTLRPAADGSGPSVINGLKDELGSEITKAAKRLAKRKARAGA